MKYEVDSPLAGGRIPHDDEEGRRALQQWATTWLEELEATKWPRGLQYFENASYLSGNHLTRYYYTADQGLAFHTFGVHDQSPYDQHVAKVADNRLVRPVETVAGMLTEVSPIGRVTPNSDLPEDEDAADLAQIVLRLTFEKPLNMKEKLRESAMVACICGTAIAEVEYTDTGNPIEVPQYKIVEEESELFRDENGDPIKTTREVVDGTEVVPRRDIQARIWTPFHITVDPTATKPEELNWIARSSFEDIDWIKEQFDRDEEGYYPEALEDLGEENASSHMLYWYAKFQDILDHPQYQHHGGGMAPATYTTTGGYAPNQVMFTVIDVKPTRDFPRGRTLVLAGGRLIYCGDARAYSEKYPWRWHPYAFFYWFKSPGRFWGIPLLSLLVPLQKKINSIDALVAANREYISLGQWWIPKHSKVSEGRISGIPGEHYIYTAVPGMQDPHRVENQPLPQELLIERDQLVVAIDYLAASGSVDDGQISASAARAGVILDFLRQEKLRSKSPMIQCFEQYLETIQQNVLIEIQLNLERDDPDLTARIRAAAREYSSAAIESFTGASLRDHHNVEIDIASELLFSPEAREAKALEAAQYLGPQMSPMQRDAVLKAIKLDRYMKDEQLASTRRARRMVSRIVNGDPEALLPMPGVDNARAMAPVFQEAILSDRFYDLPRALQEALVSGFDYYKAAAQQEFMEELQMQLAAQAAAAGESAAPQ